MRIFFTIIVCCIFNYTSFSQNDAKVETVYSLGQIPAPLGVYRHQAEASLINFTDADINDLPVVLNVTGANAFTDTQRVFLAAHDTMIVDFNTFSPWNAGTNLLTVSVPDDDDNSNNSAAYTQIVNNNTFSYADNGPLAGAVGFGTGSGILSTRYASSGSGVVTQIIVHISDQPSNIGNAVYGVVLDGASILAQSDPHVIAANELDTDVSFDIINPPSVQYNFFVGLLQTPNATPYFPVAYQNEGFKTRPSAYYASYPDGTGLAPSTTTGRFMIKAVLSIGDVTPFNSSINQPTDYVLAGWDFSGINSPSQFAATTFDTVLASSNLLTRGPGAPSSPGVHAFRTTGFQNDGISTSNTDYFQITLSPKPGDAMSLYYIGGNLHSNNSNISVPGSSIRSQFAYSLDGTNFTLIGSSFQSSNIVQEFAVALSGIAALQNIPGGSTVTIRFYATGIAANADWGFFSTRPGYNGLAVYGRLISSANNSILTDPVIPTGADYTLADCSATATGSIGFKSTGIFSAGNKYIVQLGKIYQPHANVYRFKYPVNVGEITSNANSGTINFTIPSGTSLYDYAVRIISTAPYTAGSFSQQFVVNAQNCGSQPEDFFRTKNSGNWADLNTWETIHGAGEWVPATLVPDENAGQVEILKTHVVAITSNVSSTNLIIKGELKLFNRGDSVGTITLKKQSSPVSYPMKIDTSGTFNVVSAAAVFNDAILILDGKIYCSGRITVGDGVTVAAGFEALATQSSLVNWRDGSVLEWNSTAGVGPSCVADYFPDNFTVTTLRLTNIPGGSVGSTNNFNMNGLLEVNTPVSFTGSGTKTFRDGIIGSSSLTQAPGCGKLFTTSTYQYIPPSDATVAVMQGILAGNVHIDLNEEGLVLAGGATIPDTSKVTITGSCLALQNIEVTADAELIQAADTLIIENANLLNSGKLTGPGVVRFTGNMMSTLSSPGMLTAPVTLFNKQLQLGSTVNSADLSLYAGSNLFLNSFNLNMSAASLTADSANYIVTNDTGRLSRHIAEAPVLYPVGVNATSYTPITITNPGIEDNIKVRVAQGVQAGSPILTENVDRTWIVGDTAQAISDLVLKMQWNESEEQVDFDRTNCYVSHYAVCPLNCDGAYFDFAATTAASGSSSFTIERNGINNFAYPSFIVSSKPFIYTFTGNGDWNDPINWSPALVAPAIIPRGVIVAIDPLPTGECIHNGNITIKAGAKLIVQPDKKLTVKGNLIAE
ncbi:MAG: hypothetical protein ABIN36_02520 [Ferruginibacter sp.]